MVCVYAVEVVDFVVPAEIVIMVLIAFVGDEDLDLEGDLLIVLSDHVCQVDLCRFEGMPVHGIEMVCECVIECLLPVSNELLVQTFPGFRDLRMKGFLVL